ITFTKSQILKHDGMGTELVHDEKSGSVSIIGSYKTDSTNTSLDKNPPSVFSVTLLDSSIFSKTPLMIIFNTSDAESGIKEYKMQIGDGIWKDTKSPQPIMKSIFSRNITIRAFDYSGNFRDASLHIPGILPLKNLLIVLVLLTISGIWGFKLLKYKA
ncbi:hypothetical protein K2P96_02280, partial [Patescibacteria group bacterium]|nr:hypothetical protein [Patescibacteria group bacterium]